MRDWDTGYAKILAGTWGAKLDSAATRAQWAETWDKMLRDHWGRLTINQLTYSGDPGLILFAGPVFTEHFIIF